MTWRLFFLADGAPLVEIKAHVYGSQNKGMQTWLSNIQAEPGRTDMEEQPHTGLELTNDLLSCHGRSERVAGWRPVAREALI